MSVQEPSHYAEEDMVLVAGSDYIRMASIGGGLFSIKLPTVGDSTPIVENIDGDLIAVNGGTYVDQGRLALTQIRESGEGTGLPLPNNVLMYDPNGNPKEITYSNDIPLHLSTIDVSLNIHDASLNGHDVSLNALDTNVTNLMNQGGVSYGSTFAIGSGSTADGTNSVAIGNNASTSTYNNAVAIGNGSTAGADNTFILGDGTQNVGIGTSNPTNKLQITDGSCMVEHTGANNNSLIINPNNHSNGVDIEVFQADNVSTKKSLCLNPYGGNVGIGTTSPYKTLHIEGTGLQVHTDNINTGNDTSAAHTESLIQLGVNGYGPQIHCIRNPGWTDSTDLQFWTSGANTVAYHAMTIKGHASHGRVGIGTTSPDNLLTIAGGGLQLSPYTAGTTKFLLYSENNVLQMNPRTSTGGYNNIIGLNMNSSGNVGIGTTSPSVPLHVSRATTITLSGASSYFEVHNGFKTNGNNLSKAISIKATDGIVGSSVFANSDLRIKENINDILDDSALQKLRQLNPKMYQYKDKLSRGDKTVYGFIAQEVGDILPLAVQTQEDSIPNIIQLVSIDVDHKTLHFYQGFNTQNLDASFNTLRIIDKENKEHFVDIEEIIDASHIRVDTDLSEIMGDVDESGNIIEGNKVFVYGQQVDDFHILDKNAIFTIATAALQEVDRQLQAEKAKVADLEAKNATLETQMADVLARLSALENP